MEIAYGHGGWVQVVAPELPGPLYVRFQLSERGHPRITESYLDGRGESLGRKARESLPGLLGEVEDQVLAEGREWAERSVRHVGPNLSLLAAFFDRSFGRQAKHWVSEQWRAQFEDSDVKNPRRPGDPLVLRAPEPVVLLSAPDEGLTDEFLRRVRTRYYQGAARRERPLLGTMAKEAGVSQRTVQRWVYEARLRKIMERGERGSVG